MHPEWRMFWDLSQDSLPFAFHCPLVSICSAVLRYTPVSTQIPDRQTEGAGVLVLGIWLCWGRFPLDHSNPFCYSLPHQRVCPELVFSELSSFFLQVLIHLLDCQLLNRADFFFGPPKISPLTLSRPIQSTSLPSLHFLLAFFLTHLELASVLCATRFFFWS